MLASHSSIICEMARRAGSECDASGKFDGLEGVEGESVLSRWSIQGYLLRAFSPVLSSFTLPLEGFIFDKQLVVDVPFLHSPTLSLSTTLIYQHHPCWHGFCLSLSAYWASLTMTSPVSTASASTVTTSAAGDKLVFCHFMVSTQYSTPCQHDSRY